MNVTMNIENGERVPVNNLTLEIVGPVNKTCTFYFNGTVISGCENLVITPVNVPMGSSGLSWGYGYSSDGTGPYIYQNTSFGTGYGYGYETAVLDELKFTIVWNFNSSEPINGDYNADFYAEAFGNGVHRQYKTESSSSFDVARSVFIVLTRPADDETVFGNYEANYTAGASVINVTFQYSTDNVSWATIGTDTVVNSSYTFNSAGIADGTYYIRAVAFTSDGSNASSTNENITIDNSGPTVAVISPNGGEHWVFNSTQNILWTATDPSGVLADSIIIRFYNGTGWVLVAQNESNDGTYAWTIPNVNATDAEVRVYATDNNGFMALDDSDAVFTLNATPANVAPVIGTVADRTATEDTNFVHIANATDGNGDPLTFGTNSTLFTITTVNGQGVINFTPVNNQNGTYNIRVSVYDGRGGVDSDVFALTINPVNDAPVLNPIGGLTGINTALNAYTVSAVDEEDANLTFAVQSASTLANLTVTNDAVASATVRITSGETIGWHNNVIINVTDGNSWDSETFNAFINNTNAAPVITNFSSKVGAAAATQDLATTIREDQTINYSVTFTDAQGDNTAQAQWFVRKGEDATAYNSTGGWFNMVPDSLSAGTYTIIAEVTDGIDTTTQTWNLTATDVRDSDGDGVSDYADNCKFVANAGQADTDLDTIGDACDEDQGADFDNDPINESVDFLLGNVSFVDTNIDNLTFRVENSTNTSQEFAGEKKIEFMANVINETTNQTEAVPIVEFNFTFANTTKLDLSNVTINEEIVVDPDTGEGVSVVVITGINLTGQSETKTVRITRIDASKQKVCVKDKPVASVSEISSLCNGTEEMIIPCDGATYFGQYICNYDADINKFVVEGLNHTALSQTNSTCTPSWSCDGWNTCQSNGIQSCTGWTDANSCGAVYGGGNNRACIYIEPDTVGGGGSSAATDPDVWTLVRAGETKSLDVTDPNKAVSKIDVVFEKVARNVKITVTLLDASPVDVEANKAYKYLEITKDNLDDDQISSAKIYFKVAKVWVSSYAAEPGDVVLYRFEDNKWNILPTTLVDEDDTFYYYMATSEALSYYAIGLKTKEVVAPLLVCGDGILSEGEECDDGNLVTGDGCSDACAIEAGWRCTGMPSLCGPSDDVIEPPVPPVFIKKIKELWPWLVLLLVMLIVGWWMILATARQNKKKFKIDEKELIEHNVHMPHNKIKQLESFIEHQMEKGHDHAHIRDVLVAKGWKAKVVDDILHTSAKKLKKAEAKDVKKAPPPDKADKAEKKGKKKHKKEEKKIEKKKETKKETKKDAKKEAKVGLTDAKRKELEKFVAHQLDKGYSKKDISKALKAKGWSKKQIKKLFK